MVIPYADDYDSSPNFCNLNTIHHTIPSTIILYTTIFGNQPPPLRSPYISLISWNLIILVIHYHFERSPLDDWFHTIYWSAVSFKSDLSLLSYSTLLFLKIPNPPVQIYTFHQSAAIWFYWLYNIISKNIPLLSDSIQYIDQLFHLNQTCPCYQTLHYYFRKYPTPLCKSIHSIDQLQSDSIDFTLSFRKISPCWVIP